MGANAAGPPEEFARAVNDEIRAEMARSESYRSNRKLALALGLSLDYVNRRIKNATPWDLHDLELLGRLFRLHPETFVDRAVHTMNERLAGDELAARRRTSVPQRSDEAKRAARRSTRPKGQS